MRWNHEQVYAVGQLGLQQALLDRGFRFNEQDPDYVVVGLDTDGLAGLQQLGGDATMLFYTTDEGKEGRDAFNEKRDPNFDQFPKFP